MSQIAVAIEGPGADAPEAAAPAATPAIEALESVGEYLARRGEVAHRREGDGIEAPVDTPAKPGAALAAGDPDPASQAGKELAKKKTSLQSRIDEITREKGEVERANLARIAELTAQLEAAKRPQAVAEAPAAAEVPAAAQPTGKETAKQAWERMRAQPDAPKPSEFTSYEDFLFAASTFVATQTAAEIQAQQAHLERARAFAGARDRIGGAGKAAHADFDDVSTAFVAAGHRFAPHVGDAVLGHPEGHELAYALMKDPPLNARLGAITHPVAFGMELGKVLAAAGAALNVAAAAPATPARTKAPAPVPDLDGEPAAPTGTPDPNKITTVAEWAKHRAKFAERS